MASRSPSPDPDRSGDASREDAAPDASGSRSPDARASAVEAAEEALARVEALAGKDAHDVGATGAEAAERESAAPSARGRSPGPEDARLHDEQPDPEQPDPEQPRGSRSRPAEPKASDAKAAEPDASAPGRNRDGWVQDLFLPVYAIYRFFRRATGGGTAKGGGASSARNSNADSSDPAASDPAASDPAASEPAASEPAGGSGADGDLPDQCPNCGALLDGPYCAQCGQKAEGRITPLWHMLNEALEAVFELDLRVLRTLPKFLFLPGRLTKEYIHGRRRRYLRPFRLYLFTTFALFTTLTLLRPGESPFATLTLETGDDSARIAVDASSAAGDAAAEEAAAPSLTLSSGMAPEALAQSLRARSPALADSVLDRFRRGDRLQEERFRAWVEQQAEMPADSTVLDSTVFASLREREASENVYGTPEERKRLAQNVRDSLKLKLSLTSDASTNERIERLLKEKTARAIENPREFTGMLTERMPYMMFLLLPVFALLLKLLYIRRGRLYMEHLIFTLHVHALAFFAFTVGVFMEEWGSPWVQEAGIWVLVSPFLYLLLAMRTVYEQGFAKTFFKAAVLLSTYLVILIIGVVILIVLTVILM